MWRGRGGLLGHETLHTPPSRDAETDMTEINAPHIVVRVARSVAAVMNPVR